MVRPHRGDRHCSDIKLVFLELMMYIVKPSILGHLFFHNFVNRYVLENLGPVLSQTDLSLCARKVAKMKYQMLGRIIPGCHYVCLKTQLQMRPFHCNNDEDLLSQKEFERQI